ncbi:MAG: petJ, partial [bacterium]|nr:petJ [bacterium]
MRAATICAWIAAAALAGCERKPTPPAAAATSVAPPSAATERRALGDKAVAQDCQICHSLDLVDSQRLGREAWQKEVKKMIGWGAPVPPEDEPLIVETLTARAGVDVAIAAPREIAAALVEAEVAPDPKPPAGDAHKGAALYRVACASCHG